MEEDVCSVCNECLSRSSSTRKVAPFDGYHTSSFLHIILEQCHDIQAFPTASSIDLVSQNYFDLAMNLQARETCKLNRQPNSECDVVIGSDTPGASCGTTSTIHLPRLASRPQGPLIHQECSGIDVFSSSSSSTRWLSTSALMV